MAPIKSILFAGLCFISEALAVRLLATHFSGQVYSLNLALTGPSSGSLTVQQKTGGCGVTPTWLYLDESSKTVYCFDESWAGSGVLTTYSLGASGLTQTASAKTPGNSVHGQLYGGKDGKSFVVTSEYSPSTLTTYKLPITSNSKPIETLTFTMAKPGPRPDRQDKPHPHSAFTDPTGEYLLVPDLGADVTRVFKINQDSGKLTSCATVSSQAGDGPRHGIFKKAGDVWKYYSLNEVSSSVGVYDVTYGGDCLGLTLTQTMSTYGPGVALGKTTVKSAEIRIAGDFLYASNRNDQTFGTEKDSIAIYKIDASSGKLTFGELTNSYGFFPRSFALNKNGTYVAIAGQTTANLAIVERDTETGKFGKLVANLALPPKGTNGGEDGLSSVIWDE
jgi:6-phosphogluconolactonase (cycloisomerase 2 family)